MPRTKAERLAAIQTMYLLAADNGRLSESQIAQLIADVEQVMDPHYTVTFRCRHSQMKKLLQAVNRKRNRLFFDVDLEVNEIKKSYFKLEDTQYAVTMRYATRPSGAHY